MTDSRVIHGDCIEVMRTLPDNSVDSIVTDPPYGLGFMGKAWDQLPPGLEWAEECLRVLKPGGHLLAFGGSRTWHRLAVAVEDAGFEIRDSIFWLYGSGFPKHRAALKPACEPVVMARKPFKGSLTTNEAIHGTGALNIDASRIEASLGDTWNAGLGGIGYGAGLNGYTKGEGRVAPTQGRWPANVVLDDTTAEILDQQSGISKSASSSKRGKGAGAYRMGGCQTIEELRAIAAVDGPRPDGRGSARAVLATLEAAESYAGGFDDQGGASRFFYVAKAPKRERPVVDGVAHPTVKPLALMRWLVKLVTPEGGTVLEPFAGSGATVEACILEGFNYIAIEREAEYLPLIQHRIDRAA
jgi:site-specific DNA-methyltransferase (adenine-specific)